MAGFGTILTSRRIPVGNYFPAIAGRFIRNSAGMDTTTTVLAGGANRLDISPFIPQVNITFDQLSINVTTAIAASLVKIVVYDSDEDGRPTTLLFESSDLVTSTTGVKNAAVSPSLTFLSGKIYWMGVRHSLNATLSANQIYNSLNLDNGATIATTMNKTLRRTVTFANAAPNPFVFNAAELSTAAQTAIWMRVV